jgi:hypothetical protein
VEALGTELVRALALQGTGWLLFCLATIAGVLIFRKLLEVQATSVENIKEADKLRQDLQEKRIVEAKETVAVLHEGAQANQKLADSVGVRTETLNRVVELQMAIEKDIENNNANWQLRMAALDKAFAEIRQLMVDCKRTANMMVSLVPEREASATHQRRRSDA